MRMNPILYPVMACLLLASCAGGGSSLSNSQKHQMQKLTAAQRDAIGRQTANDLRQRGFDRRSGDMEVQGVDYRAGDDTFVYRLRTHAVAKASDFDRSQRQQLQQQLAGGLGKLFCRDRGMRDLMQHGRYAFELRINARDGRSLSNPVRVTAADC